MRATRSDLSDDCLGGLESRIVERLDAIDGTPVFYIKLVMAEFEPRGSVRQPGWVAELMADCWLEDGWK